MVTSPITTPHFHSQVLTLLSTSLSHGSTNSEEDITKTKNASPVIIPPLTPADTPLTPDESISQVIGVTSSWIDLGSPDPIIADISRQVLKLELAYAAFCGLTYAVIPGPRLRGQGASDSGTVQYARAIMDALSQGPYMQLYIWLPMIDHSDDQVDSMGDLASFARPQFLDYDEYQTKRLDLFGTWEAWDMIRSICKYPSRLCVGKANKFLWATVASSLLPARALRFSPVLIYIQHYPYPKVYHRHPSSCDGILNQSESSPSTGEPLRKTTKATLSFLAPTKPSY